MIALPKKWALRAWRRSVVASSLVGRQESGPAHSNLDATMHKSAVTLGIYKVVTMDRRLKV